MQTLPTPRFPRAAARSRAIAALAALCAAGLLTGCSAPRVTGKAESEQRVSTCEAAFYAASDSTDAADADGRVLAERYQSAVDAQHAWLDVAIHCPQRFSEGVLRSAQSQYEAYLLADRIGRAYQPLTVRRLDAVDELAIGGETLAYLALAEDRAGFGTEVLAGRYAAGEGSDRDTAKLSSSGALLDISDDHKESASRLVSLAGSKQKDLRQKVYATQEIVDSPDTIKDLTTGLTANTVAVVEMDCVREELQAVAHYGTLDDVEEDDASQKQLRADLLQLAMLIATHAYTAFTLGYPDRDDVLFSAADSTK
ncbi:MAG: hypothetical protein UHD09_01185 [Bifidobacterium sp.]|nr:hypothetical protein [Bifidobacterium sp.]